MNLQKTDTFAARLLMMSFFLQENLQVFAAIGTCVYFVTRTITTKQFRPSNNLLWILLIGGGYLMYVLAIPLTAPEHQRAIFTLLERKSSYLLMPIVFAFTAPEFRSLIMRQLMFFVYGCLITCAVGNAAFMYHHFIANPATVTLSHVWYRNIFEECTSIHPTYMSMYLCVGLCITLLYATPRNRWESRLKNALLYLLLILTLALFAKAPLIALAIIAVHLLYGYRKQLYKFKLHFIAFAATVAGAYFFIPFFRQRAEELLGLLHNNKDAENITQNSVNIRKLIWDTDTNMLKHYWLTGTGPGRMLDLLHQRYFFQSVYRGYWVGYFDPHNQYFYEWLSFGIAGIAVLLLALAVQYRRAIQHKNNLYLYFLIIISITFFTESLLGRQTGILFYSIFASLFFFYTPQKKEIG